MKRFSITIGAAFLVASTALFAMHGTNTVWGRLGVMRKDNEYVVVWEPVNLRSPGAGSSARSHLREINDVPRYEKQDI